MARRYFAAEAIATEHVTLSGSEAHHLRNVMRASAGDSIKLFDGSGREFEGRIESIGRDRIEITITDQATVCRELPFVLTIGVALPKGDRQRWLIEKCCELGVTRVVPLVTQRSVAGVKKSTVSRLERFVIEASKQCGRNRLMEIAAPESIATFLQHASAKECCWLADPTGVGITSVAANNRGSNICVAIGPEGGFSEKELEQAHAAGWQSVSMGARILRTETAAVAVASIVANLV